MPIVQEYLEIGGVVVKWPPSADVLKVEPLYASSEVTLLSGRVVLQRSPLGGYRLTINGTDNFVVSQQVKDLVEGAHAGGAALHVVETLSNPQQRTVWPSCIVTACDFKEVAGSGRTLFNFSNITFLTGA